jgi:hypothetical protein
MEALIAGTFSLASIAMIVYFVAKFAVETIMDSKKHTAHH